MLPKAKTDMIFCGQLHSFARKARITSPYCLNLQNIARECFHFYLSEFISSENMMGPVFHIALTEHHAPTSIHYVPAAEVFFLWTDSPSGPKPSL
jgi:hypothetical protein